MITDNDRTECFQKSYGGEPLPASAQRGFCVNQPISQEVDRC